MLLSSFSILLLIVCGLWYWRGYAKRIANLELAISEQRDRHQKEMDDFECSVKDSIRVTAERVRDGRCKDVVDELDYMIENFDVYRCMTR